MHYAVILTAGGLSSRLGLGIKKEFFTFENGKTVLSTCAENFLRFFQEYPKYILSSLIITLPKDVLGEGEQSFYKGNVSNMCAKLALNPSFISGGTTRQQSVFNALEHISKIDPSCQAVLIQDAARPYTRMALIKRVVEGVEKHGSCVPVIQSTDTQKRINPKTRMILDHLDRATVFCVQTPQGFLFPQIYEAHNKAASSAKIYTDDSEIWADYYKNDSLFASVFSCAGEPDNIKITYSTDLPKQEQ